MLDVSGLSGDVWRVAAVVSSEASVMDASWPSNDVLDRVVSKDVEG